MSLKYLTVTLSVPAGIMLAVWGLFQLVQDSYTAEARLNAHLQHWQFLDADSSSLERQAEVLHGILEHLQSDRTLSLLQHRLAYRQYELSDLHEQLVLRVIPGTAQIRLQASANSPDASLEMVNSLGYLFVDRWVSETQKRMSEELRVLGQRLDSQQQQLYVCRSQLEARRQQLYAGSEGAVLLQLRSRIEQLEITRHAIYARVERLENSLQQQQSQQTDYQFIRVYQDDPVASLQMELQEALTQLTLVEQELLTFQRQLDKADSTHLATAQTRVQRTEQFYVLLGEQREILQNALAHVPEMLTFTPTDRSRLPSPWAIYGLTLLGGLASFLLWLVILLQIGFLKWPEPTC